MTQHEKILAIMCQHPNKWFYPYEFMKPDLGDLFVGYEAPTRLSDMQRKHPRIFECKSEDKYLQRRLNMTEYANWYRDIDLTWQQICQQHLGVPQMIIKEPVGRAISWLDEELLS